MAVKVIHHFKDGTVRENLDGVIVPPEVVMNLYHTIRVYKEEKERKERNGQNRTSQNEQ